MIAVNVAILVMLVEGRTKLGDGGTWSDVQTGSSERGSRRVKSNDCM